MNRPSFAHGKSPMIVGVIKESTPNDVICKIREGEFAGARGFDLHLPYLKKEFQDLPNLRRIMQSTDRPILALHYDTQSATDEERMALLTLAVEAGAAAADMQSYTFDRAAKDAFVDDDFIPAGMEFLSEKRPKEIACKPDVIRKQTEFIQQIHALGGEVLASVHFGMELTKEELLAVGNFARSKGADIVKMVGTCTDPHQVPAAIEATMYLKEKLEIPFSYHMNGLPGIPTRKLCPLFGSHVVFCNIDYSSQGADTEQLHVRGMVDAYRALGIL